MNSTIRLLSRQIQLLQERIDERDARFEALEDRLRLRLYRNVGKRQFVYRSTVEIPRFNSRRRKASNAQPVVRNRQISRGNLRRNRHPENRELVSRPGSESP